MKKNFMFLRWAGAALLAGSAMSQAFGIRDEYTGLLVVFMGWAMAGLLIFPDFYKRGQR